MPRVSKRRKVLNELQKMLQDRFIQHVFCTVAKVSRPIEDKLDYILLRYVDTLQRQRFLYRQPYRKQAQFGYNFNRDLDGGRHGMAAWLSNEEFLQKYRMPKEAVKKLAQLIKSNDIFSKTRAQGNAQAPVVHQLLVFLKYAGTEGSGSSAPDLRHVFGIGRGTCILYINRVTKAICDLRNHYIKWPDEEERSKIEAVIENKFNIPNCVGMMDGTLFPLAFEPETEDAPDYKGRKFGYSLSTLIINDDKKRIRYYLAGWPGCVHDNSVFKSSHVYNSPLSYFKPTQYVIADSAYTSSWFVISNYKALPNQLLRGKEEKFNATIAKARVLAEHTIGLLKGQFPSLRQIRKKIRMADQELSIQSILMHIEAVIILHNFLIDVSCTITCSNWNLEEDEIVAIRDSEAEEYIQLANTVNINVLSDDRRQVLTEYIWNKL
jgi:hypothetical protein